MYSGLKRLWTKSSITVRDFSSTLRIICFLFLADLAMASMRASSKNSNPSFWATRLAIGLPPEPGSRAMVMKG